MKKTRKIYCLFLLSGSFLIVFALGHPVNGQIDFDQRKDVISCLPSSEVFDVEQDRHKNLWFATESGICKYDGYSCKIFNTNNGLPANSVLKLQMDKYHRIWYFTFSGHIGYIYNDRVIPHPASQSQNDFLNKNFATGVHIEGANTYLNTFNGRLYVIDSNNVSGASDYFSDTSHYAFAIATFQDEFIYEFGKSDYYPNESDSFFLRQCQNKYYFYFNRLPSPNHCCYCMIDTNEFFVSLGNRMFHVEENRIINTLQLEENNSIVDIFKDESGNLWVSTLNAGVLLYQDRNILSDPEVYFEKKIVSRVFQDHELNYWFTTNTNGVHFTPSIQFKILKRTRDISILALDFLGDHIFYATYLPGLHKISVSGKTTSESATNKKIVSQIKDIYITRNKDIWLSGCSVLKIDSNGKWQHHGMPWSVYTLTMQNDTSFLIGGKHFFAKYNRYDDSIRLYKSDFKEIVMALYETKDSIIWIGTMNGLYAYYKDSLFYYGDSIPLFKSRITAINETNKYLLIGTSGSGLLVSSGMKVYQINEGKKLAGNIVRSILVENDSNFWIGTNQGLSHLVISNTPEFTFRIRNYAKSEGLMANNINDIRKRGEVMYMATDKGIIYFNPRKLKNRFIYPEVHLIHFIVNDKDTTFDISNLKNNQNNILFHFKAMSFRNPGQLTYKFKLENYDRDWMQTKELTVRYTSLPPGKYTFKVMASTDGKTFGDYSSCTFRIRKHFAQTVWFITLAITVIFFSVYLLILYILKNHKRKSEIKNKILLTEQKALRMQMNPHFVFNALGSIQNYILENESQLADIYLTDFSYLMRMTLENSKHNFVSLSNELECIRLYLKLEKLRFDDTFYYDINVSKDIKTNETRIPPMLIQPFIENAIWHGLLLKKGEKKVGINFEIKNKELLKCTIIDNGIGTIESQKLKIRSGKYRSTGIKNIRERIEVINQTYKSDMKVEIIDLSEQGKSIGTKVELYIYFIV